MKMRTGTILAAAAVAFAAMSAMATGCELISSVDRSLINGTGSGGSGGGTSTASVTTTASGTGGATSSSSGTGGSMCTDPATDCPKPASECVTAVCNMGACAVMNVAEGGAVTAQTPMDCKKVVCDGAGATHAIDDNTDVKDDGLECTTDTCAAGAEVHTPVAVKTACGAGGALKCDAAGACVGCVDVGDCGAAATCKVNTCTAGVCGVANVADATGCSDGNGCTQTDACLAGVCTGSNPVVCTALDVCHNAGACVPATGVCSASLPKGDGAACSDNDQCTQSDSCLGGVCTGTTPVICPVPDQCHTVAACAPATGTCALTPKADGTACMDGNGCTTSDTCVAGACGGTAVVCSALDECHDIGTCSGQAVCSNPQKAVNTPCAGGTKMCNAAGMCI